MQTLTIALDNNQNKPQTLTNTFFFYFVGALMSALINVYSLSFTMSLTV